jgi:hypothetical protein
LARLLGIDREALVEVRRASNPVGHGEQASLNERLASDHRGIAATREREQLVELKGGIQARNRLKADGAFVGFATLRFTSCKRLGLLGVGT